MPASPAAAAWSLPRDSCRFPPAGSRGSRGAMDRMRPARGAAADAVVAMAVVTIVTVAVSITVTAACGGLGAGEAGLERRDEVLPAAGRAGQLFLRSGVD